MPSNIKDHPIKVTLGTAAIVIITTVGFFVNINQRFNDEAIRFEQVEARQRHFEGKTDLYTERYEEVVAKQAVTDGNIIEILTKLGAIEAAILEIKISLKEHDLR